MSSGYSGNSAPRTKALDHSKVASTHKPSGKPSPIMPVKKPLVMPDKINPFKMNPAQKRKYLEHPERFDM